jgi:alpha-mannosidase
LNTHDIHRLARQNRRLVELRIWRNALEQPVENWQFTGPGGDTAQLRLGDRWPSEEFPVRLRATATVPEAWSGMPVELELWLGGEGFVQLSNGVRGGLNPMHRAYRVAESAVGGEQIEIDAEVVPKGIFGSHIYGAGIDSALLVVPETDVRALERDLSMIAEVCEQLPDHEVTPHLLDTIDAALMLLAPVWPTNSEKIISRIVGGEGASPGSGYSQRWAAESGIANPLVQGFGLWSVPEAPGSLEPLSEEARAAVRQAREAVAQRLAEIAERYPPIGGIAISGHAHIDLAWLWPLAETRRKARRTFWTQIGLMEQYPDFIFNQSSAQAYQWIEEDDPELFEAIRQRVAEGRWEPVGGAWCECDSNITGGEAFVRQHVYGQRYFQEKFGVRCSVAWFPDVFGYSAGMPQLLRGAGIDNFFTIKISWNETNELPYDLFEWEGIDGTRVLTHMFRNPAAGYNGNIAPEDVIGTWRNFKQKTRHSESLLTVGWGDGGGGTSARMLENYARLKEFPATPRLRMTRVDEFFAALPKEGIPRWVGELYLEFHRGTLTTQTKTKQLNRQAEHRLVEAEVFSAFADRNGLDYPHDEIEQAWKTLLLNQFHDILPGSSIKEVYEDNHRDMAGVVQTATRIRDGALAHLAAQIAPPEGAQQLALVGNAAIAPRLLSVVLPGVDASVTVADETGEPLPTQATDEGLLVHSTDHAVAGAGYLTLTIRPEGPEPEMELTVQATESSDGAVLENDQLRVEIGADGTLARVLDKDLQRDVLEGRGNQLWAYVDKPRVYDAWDIDQDYENEAEEIGGVTEIALVETGPLRASVRVERRWRDSRIAQTYRLHAGSLRLDIETDIELHDRQVLFRALFPLVVRSHEASFETMYGVARRPTHRNTSWDAAKFEVGGHRWADMSEPGYGVALLTDAKYGYSVHDNVLGLSLVRSPIYPDPWADEGEHHFTYSLFPHIGDWTDAEVVAEALALNSPLTVALAEPGGGSMPLEASLVSLPVEAGLLLDAGVTLGLGALKRAEDGVGLIVRVYEPHGARGTAILQFGAEVQSVQKVNFLEESIEDDAVAAEGRTVSLPVRPFEVVTLRVVM